MTRPRLYLVDEQPRDYAEPFVDLYASLAAAPDSGPISPRVCHARSTPSRGTVARKATDLLSKSWANADAPRLAALRGRYVFAYRRYRGAIAFALNAVVIAGCFLLIASGTL